MNALKNILANLKNFGIPDIIAVIALRGRNELYGTVPGKIEMSVAEACALRHNDMAEKLNLNTRDVDFGMDVWKDGEKIGYIDSDGDFDYYKAPDLRTALAWKVATDGGRDREVEIDLDAAVKKIMETIRTHGTSKKAFHGPFFRMLEEMFTYKNVSRFGDGYCGAALPLWENATRELGEEHEGYMFLY